MTQLRRRRAYEELRIKGGAQAYDPGAGGKVHGMAMELMAD